MDAGNAPAAPDPAVTAAAQSKANKETAVAQYGINATNQETPQGSLIYSQIGNWEDGTPRFQATQSYSPQEQSIYNTGTQTRQNLADIGSQQSSKIGTLLNSPYSLGDATAKKISGIQKGFLDPQWQQEEDRQQTALINKGIRPGTQQYTDAMSQFSNNRQKAYDQSYLDAYKTGEASALTERNQPINEITALMSGSQVSNPSYASTPTPGVAPTDYIGATQQSLNQQNVGYNAKVRNAEGINKGLSNLGGAALGGWMMSDIDVKENIDVVGERQDGLHVIDYNYKPDTGLGNERHRGLVAQEVAGKYPSAVARVPSQGGKLAVDYTKVPGGLFALGARRG